MRLGDLRPGLEAAAANRSLLAVPSLCTRRGLAFSALGSVIVSTPSANRPLTLKLLLLPAIDREHAVLHRDAHVLRLETGQLRGHLDLVVGLAHVHRRNPNRLSARRLAEVPVEDSVHIPARRGQLVPDRRRGRRTPEISLAAPP